MQVLCGLQVLFLLFNCQTPVIVEAVLIVLLIIFLILVVIIGSVSYGETMSDYYYYGY